MRTPSPFIDQHSLFRAYDIRGAQQHFTSEFIQALGVAFAQLYKTTNNKIKNSHSINSANTIASAIELGADIKNLSNNNPIIVIGYDVRGGSNTIARILASVLSEHELTIINLGLITTPMMAFWAQQYDGHGIMVTASHSDKYTLGVKWLINDTSPSSADIQTLYKNLSLGHSDSSTGAQYKYNNKPVLAQDPTKPLNSNASTISLPTDTVTNTYIQAIAEVFTQIYEDRSQPHIKDINNRNITPKLNLTVVIDCLNGATSKIAQPLFERFCQHVIMLNDKPDGSFPTGNPDPTEPNRLAELQQTVIVNGADMGLAFDGDGDRLMIVDNSGKVITPDHLLYLLAQVAIAERPSCHSHSTDPHVLFDIKCSHHLPKLLSALDAVPIMTRTGSSLLRRQLQTCECQALFAGELSGHFIFNDGYFIAYDDAMYAGLRLLHWMAYTADPFNINTNISAADMLLLSTDLWGEPREAILPYRMTDITQQLPTLVSTADIYIPLAEVPSCECSIVAHLTSYCRYLQGLVAEADSTLSTRTSLATVPHTSAAALNLSPSCNCFDATQDISVARAQQLLPAGTQLSCIDGVRLDFDNGFGVLRQSNTSHSLTVRFAGDSLADLKEIQARFVALCLSFDAILAAQIATIHAE